MTDPIIIRPEDATVPVKANFRYLVDAINNLLTDRQTTRDLIISENNQIKLKLNDIENNLKILIAHSEITTDEVITQNEVE